MLFVFYIKPTSKLRNLNFLIFTIIIRYAQKVSEFYDGEFNF